MTTKSAHKFASLDLADLEHASGGQGASRAAGLACVSDVWRGAGAGAIGGGAATLVTTGEPILGAVVGGALGSAGSFVFSPNCLDAGSLGAKGDSDADFTPPADGDFSYLGN